MRRKPLNPEEESREARFRIHKLVAQGFSEPHALARVFPGDPDRRRRLRIWQQQGLWPIPQSELERWHAGKLSGLSIQKAPEYSHLRAEEKAVGMEKNELQQFVSEIVQRELLPLFENVEIVPIPKSGKKGRRSVKKAFTVPSDLWLEIQGMFPGEIMSNVISAALRLYLNTKKEMDRQDAGNN